jgi:2-C-methyl-D-erythritol 4-phosphate cytidylyltransferase
VFEEQKASMKGEKSIKYALPGAERQDSVSNGFKEISSDAHLVAIHDSARPLIQEEDFRFDLVQCR